MTSRTRLSSKHAHTSRWGRIIIIIIFTITAIERPFRLFLFLKLSFVLLLSLLLFFTYPCTTFIHRAGIKVTRINRKFIGTLRPTKNTSSANIVTTVFHRITASRYTFAVHLKSGLYITYSDSLNDIIKDAFYCEFQLVAQINSIYIDGQTTLSADARSLVSSFAIQCTPFLITF